MERNEKLLRPLHRQRSRRRKRIEVVGRQDLAERYDISPEEVEAHLSQLGIAFHKDSNGGVWCSLAIEN